MPVVAAGTTCSTASATAGGASVTPPTAAGSDSATSLARSIGCRGGGTGTIGRGMLPSGGFGVLTCGGSTRGGVTLGGVTIGGVTTGGVTTGGVTTGGVTTGGVTPPVGGGVVVPPGEEGTGVRVGGICERLVGFGPLPGSAPFRAPANGAAGASARAPSSASARGRETRRGEAGEPVAGASMRSISTGAGVVPPPMTFSSAPGPTSSIGVATETASVASTASVRIWT